MTIEKINSFKDKTKKMRFLYVEDNKEIRETTYAILTNLLGTVMVANDGDTALEAYKRFAIEFYDLIITDITMERMNGFDLIKEIKKFNPKQKVVIISSHNDSKFLHEASILGVEGYLVKPLRLETLVDVIDKALSS